mmetsp:Transcript_86995/g.218967  ORF Transcript_86995/g.218967 Transcript_86995/m.218967 type:complete len:196 (-) Transcript_86995:212-799(-)
MTSENLAEKISPPAYDALQSPHKTISGTFLYLAYACGVTLCCHCSGMPNDHLRAHESPCAKQNEHSKCRTTQSQEALKTTATVAAPTAAAAPKGRWKMLFAESRAEPLLFPLFPVVLVSQVTVAPFVMFPSHSSCPGPHTAHQPLSGAAVPSLVGHEIAEVSEGTSFVPQTGVHDVPASKVLVPVCEQVPALQIH